MPRKIRRTSRATSKPKLTWQILFLAFVPVLAIALILFRSNNQNVLGTTDTKLFNTSDCKPGIISVISFSTPCGSKDRMGFKTVQFTCSDGTKGGSTNNCLSPQSALEKAGKTCSKNSKCAKPSITPRPVSPTSTPSSN